ncbi:MAG: ABC transporter ATP-binding protein [Abitibacteriaceae bacterium]|nr:ABC transporter ATP-binding protein [Abditibacteriaceae bacterium]MBV9864079.1 ABC transporter ATP-binding protein [Abditibacteriaceae bacterium]
MLQVENLNVYYGVIHALHDVSLAVGAGEIVTLIGSNGAGKSTTLLTLSGLLQPTSGNVRFEDKDLLSLLPHQRVTRGLVQVPEGRRVFSTLTVAENLDLGSYTRRDKAQVKQDLEEVYALFPRLRERRGQQAGTLSGGEQQMLAVGRAMMSRPRLLLLDEPSLGLAPLLVKEIFNVVKRIRDQGVTVLLVEQNAHMSLAIADRAYVLETGRVVMSGPAQEIARDPRVKEAYLGT